MDHSDFNEFNKTNELNKLNEQFNEEQPSKFHTPCLLDFLDDQEETPLNPWHLYHGPSNAGQSSPTLYELLEDIQDHPLDLGPPSEECVAFWEEIDEWIKQLLATPPREDEDNKCDIPTKKEGPQEDLQVNPEEKAEEIEFVRSLLESLLNIVNDKQNVV